MALVSVQPIAAGYAYGLRLTFAGIAPPIGAGWALRAEVRDYPGAPVLAGALTTQAGTIAIIDARTLELYLPPALTGALQRPTCALDLVRTDSTPVAWMGVQIVLPVTTTVTRAPDDHVPPGRVGNSPIGSVLATVLTAPGVIVTLSVALGLGPQAPIKAVAPAAIVSVGLVPAPTVSLRLSLAIGPVSIGSAVLLGVPAIAAAPSSVLVPGPIATTRLPAPTLALVSPTPTPTYLAAGYVADGYVGAA